MLQIFFSIVILFTGSFFTFGQAAPDAEVLRKLLDEFLAGAGRNDAAVHDRFWAEDLIYTRSAGARVNKAGLMSGVRSAKPGQPGDPVTVYSAEDVQIQQYGDAAVVAFRLIGKTTSSDGKQSVSEHLNTGTFIKRGDKWQAVAWQATSIPKPEDLASKMTSTQICPAEDKNEKPVPVIKSDSRTYEKGPRGGCFYTTASGRKVYVDKSHCN